MDIKTLDIRDQINTYFRTYALYVIESRGIPNFYDGITPVQRQILLNAPDKFEKTIGLVGSVMKTGLYHHGDCLSYDMEINLADGTTIKIGEWAEKYPGVSLFVKCLDAENNPTISIGHSPRIGHITNEFYELELDNGEIIKCTGNHPFLTQRGWIHAEKLLDDDILIEY